jgi:hypothetical protein
VRNAFVVDGQGWIALAIALPLAGLALYDAVKGRMSALFGCIWFVLGLAPFLPLAHHLSDYYLFFPSAGLALAAATIVVNQGRRHWVIGAVAAGALLAWIGFTIPAAQKQAASNYAQSIRARDLITDLAAARAQHPSKTLLLAGIDEDFFHASIGHHLLHVAGLFNAYLAPGGFAPESFALPARETRRGLQRGSVIVYDASASPLQDITREYVELGASQ